MTRLPSRHEVPGAAPGLLSDFTASFRLGCCCAAMLLGLMIGRTQSESLTFRGRTYRLKSSLHPYGVWITPVDH